MNLKVFQLKQLFPSEQDVRSHLWFSLSIRLYCISYSYIRINTLYSWPQTPPTTYYIIRLLTSWPINATFPGFYQSAWLLFEVRTVPLQSITSFFLWQWTVQMSSLVFSCISGFVSNQDRNVTIGHVVYSARHQTSTEVVLLEWLRYCFLWLWTFRISAFMGFSIEDMFCQQNRNVTMPQVL